MVVEAITPERMYVLTDAGTYSAAFHYAFYLWKMGAIIVGVSSSQPPNTIPPIPVGHHRGQALILSPYHRTSAKTQFFFEFWLMFCLA